MGTTAQKINRLSQTKSDLKTVINYAGGNVVDETTFKEYPKKLYKAYIDILNNGTDDLYDALPKTTEEGTTANLDTEEGKMSLIPTASEIKQANLPDGYTQVDYIESSETQYINTNVILKPTSKIEMDAKFKDVSTQKRLFGTADTETNGLCMSMYINGSGKFSWSCQNNTANWKATSLTADTLRHLFTMDLNNNKVSIDNYQENITTTITNTSIGSILLFTYANSSGNPHLNYIPNLIVYSCKIYDNNVLVRDLIPCYRNSDNVVGLYDLINDVFYTNQGTGSFIYGDIVNIPNPDYPQDIHVITGNNNIKIQNKNLLNPNKFEINTYYGITKTNMDKGKIGLSGTSTQSNAAAIAITQSGSENTIFLKKNITYYFSANWSDEHTPSTSVLRMDIRPYNNLDTILAYETSKSGGSYTPSEDIYVRLFMRCPALYIVPSNLTIQPIITTSSDTTFVEYQEQNYSLTLGSLEYCKTGNYVDQIFKNTIDSEFYDDTLVEGDWYLIKNIKKYIGGWRKGGTQNFNDSNIFYGTTTDTVGSSFTPLCSHLPYYRGIYDTNKIAIDRYTNSNELGIRLPSSIATTIEDVSDWITNNNVKIYYATNNPTVIHISENDYPVLYQDLEDIYNNAKSYDGVTHITQTNDDLPFNLEVSALAKIE